mgnify:CR=1 FL=1
MKAYVRDDLIEFNKEVPSSSINLPFEDWETLDFEIVETEEDFETEEGFNMIIKYPITGALIYVCSIDFNFKH